MTNLIGGRMLRLEWAATCMECGCALMPGDRAWWFHLEDVGRCATCAEPFIAGSQTPVTTAPPSVGEPVPLVEPPVPRPTAPPPPAPVPAQAPETQSVSVPGPALQRRVAGESAQAEYERRRREDRRQIRNKLPVLLPVLAAASLVAYFGTAILFGLLDAVLTAMDSTGGDQSVEPVPEFTDGVIQMIGLLAAAAVCIGVARSVLAPRQSTEAWRIGAAGERLTAHELEQLPPSYRVLHDLSMPDSEANIDHVVIGPTGVFTVETKNYKNGVRISRGRVYGAGRNLYGVVQQARRQAAAVAGMTGTTVIPVVCVHRGGVTADGRSGQSAVNGVRFCSGRRLTKTITRYPVELGEDEIEQIEQQLI